MRIHYKYLKFSGFELIGVFLLAVIIIIIANARYMLNYYGLASSGDVVRNNTAATVNGGLQKIDSFALTNQIVTFLIWAGVGLFCFSVVQAILGVRAEIKRTQQLGSQQYVHPAAFSKQRFWHQVFEEFGILFSGLILTAVTVTLLFSLILPIVIDYSRTFLVGFSISNSGNLLIGLALLYGWLLLVWFGGHILRHYRQVIETS